MVTEDTGKDRTPGTSEVDLEPEASGGSSLSERATVKGVKIGRCNEVDIDTEEVKAQVAQEISSDLNLKKILREHLSTTLAEKIVNFIMFILAT